MSHGIKSTGLRSSLVGNDSYYVPPLPKPPNLPPLPSNKHNIPAPAGAPPPVGAQSRPHSSSRFGDHYPLKPPGCSASRDYTDLAVLLEKANNDRKSIEMEHAALKDRLEIERKEAKKMKEEFEAKESERIAAAAANPSPTGRGGSVDNLSDPAHVANLLERAAMGHKIKEKINFI